MAVGGVCATLAPSLESAVRIMSCCAGLFLPCSSAGKRSAQACWMKARRVETWLATARFTPATRRRRHAIATVRYQINKDAAEMTHDELRQLEGARRRTLWALASLRPGDPNASHLLAILDDLDDQEPNDTPCNDRLLELTEVRNSVSVMRHSSGIDIILKRTIPQPWRERFYQASIGSTRLVDGPYASGWDKFLASWEAEMRHLEQHRAARYKSKKE